LEWARTSFEQSVAEFYTILLEEHLQVALEMLEMGNCFSLWSPKLSREDIEVHLHALQTITERLDVAVSTRSLSGGPMF
jgi:tRNA G10  N-methylase Trm11